jgi:hypothetical protein
VISVIIMHFRNNGGELTFGCSVSMSRMDLEVPFSLFNSSEFNENVAAVLCYKRHAVEAIHSVENNSHSFSIAVKKSMIICF